MGLAARHIGCADEELGQWVLRSRLEQAALGSRIPDPLELRGPRPRPPGPGLPWVKNTVLGNVACREYSAGQLQRTHVLVFAHGGAFVAGSLQSHDRLCRELAISTGRMVVAVNYRLAPEFPAPAAVEDVAAVMRALHREAAADGISLDVALGGDSAGATLALLAALRLHQAAPELVPSALWLICPNVDLTGRMARESDCAEGWGLSAAAMSHCLRLWAGAEAVSLTDSCAELLGALCGGEHPPRVLVATAGLDPLEAEGHRLAAALGVTPLHFPGLVHGFVQLGDVSPACATATREVVAWDGLRARGYPISSVMRPSTK